MTRLTQNPTKAEVCDCDLNLDPHKPNRDHYRACKAIYERDGLTLSCRVIRGHFPKTPHWTVFTREARWGEDGKAVFDKLEDDAP